MKVQVKNNLTFIAKKCGVRYGNERKFSKHIFQFVKVFFFIRKKFKCLEI